jgi:UPF0755 protein
MSQVKRLRRSQTSTKSGSGAIRLATRVLVLMLTIGLLVVAAGLLLRSISQHGDPTAVQFKLIVNPSLNPAEATLLGAYLSTNQDALNTPVSSDATPIVFAVNPGETASQIAANLAGLKLIGDETLFRNYMRYYGLDTQIEAGSYQITRNMTIPQIAVALTEATPPEITLRITEGWRREQIAEWIDQQADMPFSGADFLSATGIGVALPPETSLATEIPAGSTLEGFLFPDTYRIAIEGTAPDLVKRLLIHFDEQVTPQMRVDATARGMTLYDVIKLASIVEREAVLDEERPIIASVYLNRLREGVKLEADPTVQYAAGRSGEWWWKPPSVEAYRTVDSPYNTYIYPGLPPGPIASPGLASIRAAAEPAATRYCFFVATGDGGHVFAERLAEHQQNVQKYQK